MIVEDYLSFDLCVKINQSIKGSDDEKIISDGFNTFIEYRIC